MSTSPPAREEHTTDIDACPSFRIGFIGSRTTAVFGQTTSAPLAVDTHMYVCVHSPAWFFFMGETVRTLPRFLLFPPGIDECGMHDQEYAAYTWTAPTLLVLRLTIQAQGQLARVLCSCARWASMLPSSLPHHARLPLQRVVCLHTYPRIA